MREQTLYDVPYCLQPKDKLNNCGVPWQYYDTRQSSTSTMILLQMSHIPSRIKLLSDFTKAITIGYDREDIEQTDPSCKRRIWQSGSNTLNGPIYRSVPIHTTGAALFAAAIDTSRFNYAFFTTRNKAMEFLMG
jgi:hypothetical protein